MYSTSLMIASTAPGLPVRNLAFGTWYLLVQRSSVPEHLKGPRRANQPDTQGLSGAPPHQLHTNTNTVTQKEEITPR